MIEELLQVCLRSILVVEQEVIHRIFFKKRCRLDTRKHFFSFRIVDLWNNLPQHVIDASTVRKFEILLDEHWKSDCNCNIYEH